jgi:Tol biopolymer transport system component
MIRLGFLLITMFLSWLGTGGVRVAAQFEAPLEGPLVAVTPARQDGIVIYDLNGERSRTLAFGPGEHHLWGFSPDGCRVLFTVDKYRRGLPRMFTARLDGSDVQEMVRYDELGADAWGVWEPAWSPQLADGTSRIAFTMIRRQPNVRGEIEQTHHIAWIDATDPSVGLRAPEFYSVTGSEFTPQWSPDGQWLAYVSYQERVPGADIFSTAVPTEPPPPGEIPDEVTMLLEADLWVVSTDGEIKYRLTHFTTGSVRTPRWSPDSELIGFIYSPSPYNDTIWMIANREGAIPTQLNELWHQVLDHHWLPDGSAMAASVRGLQEIEQNRLWRIALIGNADRDATLFLSDPVFSHTDWPRFSADGRYLALRSHHTLVIVDLETATWQHLDTGRPGNTPPFWSPAAFNGEENCP